MTLRAIDNDSDVLSGEDPTANESPSKQDDIDGSEDGDDLSEEEMQSKIGKHTTIHNNDQEKVIENEDIEKDEIDDSDDSSKPKRRPTEIPLKKHTLSSSKKRIVKWNGTTLVLILRLMILINHPYLIPSNTRRSKLANKSSQIIRPSYI